MRAIQNIFSSAKNDGRELICFDSNNTECQNAIASITSDNFNNKAYQQQAKDIAIAEEGILVGPKGDYYRLMIKNKECIENLVAFCGGKLCLNHVEQIN